MGPVFLLLSVLLLSGGLVWLLAVWAYAHRLLAPPRLTDGKALYRLGRVSPADLGWPFASLEWTSADGLTLRAWSIPTTTQGPSKTFAVLIHGYADAKVGAVAWAPLFRDLGFHLVLPDLRAHGESGGTVTTAGVREGEDLFRLLNQLAEAQPGARFVLFGASLGGAAALRAAADRSDVAAIVLDSPVPSFADGAVAHSRLLALPGPAIVRPAVAWAQWRLGVRFEEAAVERLLPTSCAPALVILPQDDGFLTPDGRRRLIAAARALARRLPQSRVIQPPGTHLLALHADPSGYRSHLLDFLTSVSPDLTRTAASAPAPNTPDAGTPPC